jgi:hypothetical protein
MLAAGIETPVPLEELESHLREDVEQQMRAGSSAQDAFAAAVERMGQASAVRDEFEKMRPAGPLLAPRYLSSFCLVSAPFMLLVSAWALLADDVSMVERGWGLATVSALVLYMSVLPRLRRRLPDSRSVPVGAALQWVSVFFIGWPLFLLSISLEIVQVKLGTAVEMIAAAAYVSAFATWLAYAVRGVFAAFPGRGARCRARLFARFSRLLGIRAGHRAGDRQGESRPAGRMPPRLRIPDSGDLLMRPDRSNPAVVRSQEWLNPPLLVAKLRGLI